MAIETAAPTDQGASGFPPGRRQATVPGPQANAIGAARSISHVLWDVFTASAPYPEVFSRALDPRFVGRLAWESFLALAGRGRASEGMVCGEW